MVADVAEVADVAVAALPPIDKLEAVPVNPVPAPLNEVADKTPVFGTKLSFVELVSAPVILPLVTDDKIGYQVDTEVVVSVIVIPVAGAAAHVGNPLAKVKIYPFVPGARKVVVFTAD